jgi:pimeloyl-ACP methyl ester carboxylesterase
MLKRVLPLILFCLLLTSCSPQRATPVATPAIELTDCILPLPSGDQIEARCGSLNVPEDRADPSSRQIPLRIAVIPAINSSPSPDPLFLLAGGPGQSAVKDFPALVLYLNSVHENRDIVLVDQRGTGESNPLRCLDPEEEKSLSDEQQVELLRACPKQLNADLRFYTTEIAMQDLDQVRAALGYDTINLYGASYGTRAALTYLRLFPEKVRTVTLDAVVDPGFVLFQDSAQDGQIALDHLFTRCGADDACRSAFPDLKSEFTKLLNRLEADPVTITMPHPVTSTPLTLTITREMVADTVFTTLYSPDLAAMLPLVIHTAYADDNYVPLVSMSYLLDADVYDGMYYAVACSEDAPLLSLSQTGEHTQDSLFTDHVDEFIKVCEKWPKGSVSEEFRSPLSSDVPVLILSGEDDPITPPSHADKVAHTLKNELHLVFKGMGHGNALNLCSTGLIKTFIENASTTGLDTSCVEGIKPPPFFINFNGPHP